MSKLTATELIALQKIFEDQKWIDTALNDAGDNIFESIVEFLELIDSDNRQLVMDMLKSYIRVNDYDPYCRSLAKSFMEKFDSKETVYLLPVCDSEPIIKSGHVVAYEMLKFIPKDKYKKLVNYDHHRWFEVKKLNIIANSKIVLVDDFIGTGSQCRKMISTLRKYFPESNIHLFVICIQEAAYKKIAPVVSSLEACIVRKKALKDGFGIGGLAYKQAFDMYKAIEVQLSMHPKYCLGYGRTEALVTMKRTPNNTLPIFWQRKRKGGLKWPAIFPRL